MKQCEQAPSLNMLQHGQMVYEKYKALIAALDLGLGDPILLKIYEKYKGHLPPTKILKRYMWLHDCGKGLCLEIGEDGKRRFPNHAEVSANQFANLFPEDGFTTTLIRMDMDFHILRGDDLIRLCRSPLSPILYFTAWAEIFANAEMFGGIESDSFKIKAKRLIQAGKKLLNS
jgi:hypothetical protein